jgi:hypothetical protein
MAEARNREEFGDALDEPEDDGLPVVHARPLWLRSGPGEQPTGLADSRRTGGSPPLKPRETTAPADNPGTYLRLTGHHERQRSGLSGAAGPNAEPVSAAGFLIFIATARVGLRATIAWWKRADQTS